MSNTQNKVVIITGASNGIGTFSNTFTMAMNQEIAKTVMETVSDCVYREIYHRDGGTVGESNPRALHESPIK